MFNLIFEIFPFCFSSLENLKLSSVIMSNVYLVQNVKLTTIIRLKEHQVMKLMFKMMMMMMTKNFFMVNVKVINHYIQDEQFIQNIILTKVFHHQRHRRQRVVRIVQHLHRHHQKSMIHRNYQQIENVQLSIPHLVRVQRRQTPQQRVRQIKMSKKKTKQKNPQNQNQIINNDHRQLNDRKRRITIEKKLYKEKSNDEKTSKIKSTKNFL